MRLRRYYVYILTNEHNTVLYIGMTNDIMRHAETAFRRRIHRLRQEFSLRRSHG